MKHNLDYILTHIKQRGKANKEAIIAHRSVKAGERGAFGKLPVFASLVCKASPSLSRSASSHLSRARFRIRKDYGKPIVTDGTKGYIRNPVTGQITTCVSPE